MNIYACLDDSDDDVPVVKVATKKQEKVAPKKDDKVPVKKEAIAKPAANSAAAKPKADKKENTPSNNGASKAPSVPAGENGEPKKDDSRSRTKRDGVHTNNQNRTERRERQDRRKDELVPGGREEKPQTRAKREFDRRPSSGRSGGQSKGGSGAHGFGNEQEEALLAEKNPELAANEAEPTEEAAAAGDAAPAVEDVAAAPLPEPEPATLTYDEYLAKRDESRANSEAFGAVNRLRQVDASEFQGLKTTQKEDTVFIKISLGDKAKKDAAPPAAAKKEQRSTAKNAVEVNFKSAPTYEADDRPRREFGGPRDESRGGRVSGRGDGGRGGGRGDGGRSAFRRESGGSYPARGSAININDNDSFPSL